MKTFFEHFLDEVARRQEAGEIDSEQAQRWIAELEQQLHAYARIHPGAPIVQLPRKH